MAARLSYMFDTSVFTHMQHRSVVASMDELEGEMVVANMTCLEYGFSAVSAAQWVARQEVIAGLAQVAETINVDFVRGLEVQQLLAERGLKGRKPPDLLIAAMAERLGAIVVHYDNDYALISDVTGQPNHWIVPQGSLAPTATGKD